jgi:hypothetical protein
MTQSIREVGLITMQSRLLALNAQIEAARAGGEVGAAFGVVATAMASLSEQTSHVSGSLAEETRSAIDELRIISDRLASDVRGVRLSDLALNNIDLIDRCLYERTCDCRWWAADDSCVLALTKGEASAIQRCSQRLGVILGAYTVYFDLVLADARGRIVANGKPRTYRNVGRDCSRETWFTSAIRTASANDFGFQGVHQSSLVNGERTVVYSAAVREGGSARGKPIGVLGVLFNWDALARRIVENTPLAANEKSRTRVCIVDERGTVLADSRHHELIDQIEFPERDRLFGEAKSFLRAKVGGRESLVGYAKSPGFETYATGWRSLLIQDASG